jgi:hypothetical protein
MLLFNDWKEKMDKMNEAVATSKAKCKLFRQREILVGLAILIRAAEFAQICCDLFSVKDQLMEDGKKKRKPGSLCLQSVTLRGSCHSKGGRSFKDVSRRPSQTMI